MFDKLRAYFNKHSELPSKHQKRIEQIERMIDTPIDDPFLFIKALRHRSILADDSFSSTDSYERLEFLGDAVLDLIVTEIIYYEYPDENEGFLTKLRAKLVKGDALADYARHLKLSEILVLGDRARGQGIEFSKSVLADVFEALIGAIYLDSGYESASRFVKKLIKKHVDIDSLSETLDNYKSLLLEYAQANQMAIPRYEVIKEYGPGHDKTFEVKVLVDNQEMGQGKGKSKKEAEQRAAKSAMQSLED
ncbi:ribonuclease III [Balneolaceae bacterium YR4-1]|uniref:Ribonuclease 3 n=1 Tax=Halalkalibaculum roseum TaxID=2709311 RepID=A0A6M1SV50_9BACT|nr:ribonuclease III [Halalkalibaculum roseum]NGP76702.1 ribonuclease III [Halalkalibaculum roseum]